jgi:HD superfamily phosphohydrolase
VGGFVRVSEKIHLDLIDHPYFQRLRRINQLGLTHLVFPGANHTRFQHALGAYQLMNETIENLRNKDVDISSDESKALLTAILLHDIGHGPFSHALEESIVGSTNHEDISLFLMKSLDKKFGGELTQGIELFQDHYHRPFFHELISSQLDIDRLDYLRRDSFYTGVSEGSIGSDRIIRMMNVRNDQLVIEQKGIYSIENFLIARRLMYWQVYLHKTVISAEQLMVKILARAKELSGRKIKLPAIDSLAFFLENDIQKEDFNNEEVLNKFVGLDDNDIIQSVKLWTNSSDQVLSMLCNNLLNRKLFKIEFFNSEVNEQKITELKSQIVTKYKVCHEDSKYFVFSDSVTNYFYDVSGTKINILLNNESIVDITNTLSGFNVSILTDPVQRYYLCYPKILTESK